MFPNGIPGFNTTNSQQQAINSLLNGTLNRTNFGLLNNFGLSNNTNSILLTNQAQNVLQAQSSYNSLRTHIQHTLFPSANSNQLNTLGLFSGLLGVPSSELIFQIGHLL